jgi:hypothetical protein
MNRDPKVVGKARVYAETMAEVVNGFVDPISWKTLVSGSTSFSVSCLKSFNGSFSL